MDAQRWVLLGLLAIVMVGVLFYSLTLARRLSRLKRDNGEEPRDDSPPVPPAPSASPPAAPGSQEVPRAPASPMSRLSTLDFDGTPPPAAKGSEAEEAAKLLAGQQPKGLPSFSELAAARSADVQANAAAEEDSAAMEALSLRSMIGLRRVKPVLKQEGAPPPTIEELLAQELAEKKAAGAMPSASPGGPAAPSAVDDPLARLLASSSPKAQPGGPAPATTGLARPGPGPVSPAKLTPEALAGLAALGGARAPAAPSAPARPAAASSAGLSASPATPADSARPAVDVATLERQYLSNPEDQEAKRTLAERYLEVDRLDEAIAALVELVESDAAKESDLFNLGVALARRGYPDDARSCFLRLKSQGQGTPWAAKAAVQLLKLKLGSS